MNAVTFETERFFAPVSSETQVKRIEQGDEFIYFHFRRNSARAESYLDCARGIQAECAESIELHLVLHLNCSLRYSIGHVCREQCRPSLNSTA